MKVSYNWLKEYIGADISPHELADKLTMIGLEVESTAELGKDIKGVVVAEIVSKEKHPNADRLSFCKVKTDKGVHEIVCGANNMNAGDFAALALPGAVLPKGINIEKTKIRGVTSEGMLCSEVELGLKDTSEGIMILQKDLTLGEDITKALDIKDFILDVNVTPNRADCLSIIGIARETAAAFNKKVQVTKRKLQETDKPIKNFISVKIDEPELCHRYTARVIEDVAVKDSPDWLKKRLTNLGIRPINNIVDITNYVMLEYGQPLHAFDYDKIADKKIIVRKSKKGEGITTLDGVKRALDEGVLVIADSKTPAALAGIMGGEGSEVASNTKIILLESACFEPANIRRTSKAMGLSTESSYRFERGVDIEGVPNALNRAAELISELADGKIAKGFIDEETKPYEPLNIKFRSKKVNEILGTNLDEKDIDICLARLGFSFDKSIGTVVPPSFRVDIKIETDLIEEIARINGYENIPITIPKAELTAGTKTGIDILIDRIKGFLVNNGFLESINYSFISTSLLSITETSAHNSIKLLNPLSEEQSVMRKSLIPGLLSNLQYNINHKNLDLRLFETGPVFNQKDNIPEEKTFVSGLISGLRMSEQGLLWGKDHVDFFDMKGILENLLGIIDIKDFAFEPKKDISYLHPGRSCSIAVNKVNIGILGEIHPSAADKLDLKQPAYVFEIDIDKIINLRQGQKTFKQIPCYPSIIRDIAIIIDNKVSFKELSDAIISMDIKLVEDVKVFDVYYGKNIPEGKKSAALRLIYRSDERTLTDDDANTMHNNVVDKLIKKFGAEIRGV